MSLQKTKGRWYSWCSWQSLANTNRIQSLERKKKKNQQRLANTRFLAGSFLFCIVGWWSYYSHDNEEWSLDLLPTLARREHYTTDDDFTNLLWKGHVYRNDTRTISTTTTRRPLEIVISHCRTDLDWLSDYTQAFASSPSSSSSSSHESNSFSISNVTILSKCNKTARLPSNLHGVATTIVTLNNIGRIDHTIAYWLNDLVTAATSTRHDNNTLVVFLKDTLAQHGGASPQHLFQMVQRAAQQNFACFNDNPDRFSHFHDTPTLLRYSYAGDGRYQVQPNSNHEFLSRYAHLREWLDHLRISLSQPLTPVCYGGSFAVSMSQIQQAHQEQNHVFAKLSTALSRGDNIEEGHFAERVWASLLAPSLSEPLVQQLRAQATGGVNQKLYADGGGRLGALVRKLK